jgi:hypothetical protein
MGLSNALLLKIFSYLTLNYKTTVAKVVCGLLCSPLLQTHSITANFL